LKPFAAGLLVSPLREIILGRIVDLVGRQRAILLSVMVMAIPTVLMGCLPTFQMIGLAAPILLVLLRLVQGLSPGMTLGSGVGFMMASLLPPDQLELWAWRIPFLLGGGVAFVVIILHGDFWMLDSNHHVVAHCLCTELKVTG
jgi:MHS family proline/betaine transporter-like MFS transporter